MALLTADQTLVECDFCKIKGVLHRHIQDHQGWFFCRPCYEEIDLEIQKRKEKVEA